LFHALLSENGAMMHLARSRKVETSRIRAKPRPWLRLSPPMRRATSRGVSRSGVARFDYALKSQEGASLRRAQAACEEDEEAARVGAGAISTEEPTPIAAEARAQPGMATPISAASSRLSIMASAITPPSATLP
jgi:hypothetical protein